MMGETFWVNTKARNNMARYRFFKSSIDDDQLYLESFRETHYRQKVRRPTLNLKYKSAQMRSLCDCCQKTKPTCDILLMVMKLSGWPKMSPCIIRKYSKLTFQQVQIVLLQQTQTDKLDLQNICCSVAKKHKYSSEVLSRIHFNKISDSFGSSFKLHSYQVKFDFFKVGNFLMSALHLLRGSKETPWQLDGCAYEIRIHNL